MQIILAIHFIIKRLRGWILQNFQSREMVLNYIEQLVNAPPFTVISVLTVLLSLLYLYLKNRNLPPGPTGVPILGYWPFLENETIHVQLAELKKKYGDVYSLNLAGKLQIHLGSIKAVKEACVTKGFSERYTGFSPLNLLFEEGLLTVSGENWSTLRKFFVQMYREYGMSSVRGYMTGPVYDSVNASVSDMKAVVGKTVNIVPILQAHSLDIFRYLVFRNDNITEEELRGITSAYEKVLQLGSGKNILLAGNIAKYLIVPRIKGFKDMRVHYNTVEQIMTAIIRRHENSYDPENIRNMVDSYIRERNERRQKGDPTVKYFTDTAFVSTLFQMIGDGIVTVGMFIGYFVHPLVRYPEIQEKIYEELEDLAGPDRQITLDDRNKLPYTNAFINEVMRTTNFFTLFIGFECREETTLQGHRIPKGAMTFVNYWACHRDPKTYEDPDVFNPSRFVTEPGKPKPETPILFGVGKRSCIGEYFVMMQVFLFLTALVKNFRIEGSKTEAKKSFFDGSMEVTVFSRK